MKRIFLYAAIFLVGAGAAFCTEKTKEVLSVDEIKQLSEEIKEAEKRLLNIKVESETRIEIKGILSDPCEAWVRTPIYVHSTAWYDGQDRRKARVDVHEEIIEWRNGPSDYAEERYSAGFDGESGRYVHYSTSYDGETTENKKGELSAGVPKVLKSSWCHSFTGARFSLYLFFSNKDRFRSFSQVLDSLAAESEPSEVREVTREEFGGRKCIRIFAGKKGKGRQVFWLDAARGYGLVGYELIHVREDGSERVVGRIRVRKMKEVGSGIWWPVEGYIESEPNKRGRACQRLVYRALDVVCNDPNFSEDVFTVDFPKGYMIEDKALGVKYKFLGK